MRLYERTLELHPYPPLPTQQHISPLTLPLPLIQLRRYSANERQSFLHYGIGLEELEAGGWGAGEEGFEEHAVSRDALDGKEEVGFEGDLRMAGVRSGLLGGCVSVE